MDSWSTVRTDLALEARESIEDKADGLHGVTVEEHYDETSDVHITKVVVETKNGAKMLGNPMGVYINTPRAGQGAVNFGGGTGKPGSDGGFPRAQCGG